jgi:hypothetical protein
MQSIDIQSTIQSIISSRVQSALEPYLVFLRRISTIFGSDTKPNHPKKAAEAKHQNEVNREINRVQHSQDMITITRPMKDKPISRISSLSIAALANFKVGDAVEYQQGRGKFEAKVVAIQHTTGLLTLERQFDRRQIIRPASKVALLDKFSPPKSSETSSLEVSAVKPIIRKRTPIPESISTEATNGKHSPTANTPSHASTNSDDAFWVQVSQKLKEQETRNLHSLHSKDEYRN